MFFSGLRKELMITVMNSSQRDELAELRKRRESLGGAAPGSRPEWYSDKDPEREQSIKMRHDMKRRKMRSRFIMRRTVTLGVMCVVLAALIIFISSLFGAFNARILVKYEGEQLQKVSNEQLGECLSELNNMSIFKITDRLVREKMSQIPYIDKENIRVAKKYIPASVTIYYTEESPYGYVKQGDVYIVFDKDGKSLEYSESPPEEIPYVIGMNELVKSKTQVFEGGSARTDALFLCLRKMTEYELIGRVTRITVDENDLISFSYEDRYTVNCGSSYEISAKLGLFKSAVNHGSMTDSARGTFDLSEPGKAVYSPELTELGETASASENKTEKSDKTEENDKTDKK